MPASEPFLKFLCVLKKRKGDGFRHYKNMIGNYDQEHEFLGAYGFKSWSDLQAETADVLEGFVACQMRPFSKMSMNEQGTARYHSVDYSAPFSEWKFALRHQPWELPGWLNIAEAKAECLRLLPQWASYHLVKKGIAVCKEGQALVALGTSRIDQQSGGSCWAYGESSVIQSERCHGLAYLHDRSIGYIHAAAVGFENSRLEIFPGASVTAFGQSTVILRDGPDARELGRVVAYSPEIKIFKIKPGKGKARSMEKSLTPDNDLLPVEFTPEPEPRPFWDPEEQGRNAPFNQAVE